VEHSFRTVILSSLEFNELKGKMKKEAVLKQGRKWMRPE